MVLQNCSATAAASAASLTRRSVGQRCVVPLLLRPRAARAEIYDGSSPLELVDDVAAAIEREFYDASLMKSGAWRAAVAAARERALDADGAAAGPAIVAELCKATGDPYTRFLPPQLAAALRSTAASGAAATGGVGLRLAAEDAVAAEPPASTPRWRPRGAGARRGSLDLRGDGGGNVDGALDAAALFLGGSALVATVKTRAATEARVAPRGPPRYSEPLAVLAAELLAGALQARKRAVLVGGARTYGKARIQRALDLPGGGSVLVSRASYLTPDGADLNGVGLKADVLSDGDARACLASDPRTRL
ncbi:serine-type peptidase [Aureococcus anophagefferens]|nr:serine-type peptidase [Aureococcus anophagefferens]